MMEILPLPGNYGYWANGATLFMAVAGVVALIEILKAAWGFAHALWAAVRTMGPVAVVGAGLVLAAGAAALFSVVVLLSVLPAMYGVTVYERWVDHGLDWGYVLRPALLTGPVAVGPWLCLTILGLFLAGHGEAGRTYSAIFKALLSGAVLTTVGWLVLVIIERMAWWVILFPLPSIALSGLGLVWTRQRAGEERRSADQPPHVAILRNAGFVLVCMVAAWVGLEAGGKGISILRSLMSAL